MTRQVVALTGISGVGKSTLIKTLAASIPLLHLQASELIKERRCASGDVEVTHDQLRLVDIDKNQQFLIRGFRLNADASTSMVILDGHTVIERDTGLARIDSRVFGAIGIDSMIFLADDPEAIGQRRCNDASRKRPVLSVGGLRLIQKEAEDHAAEICRALGIPLHKFRLDQSPLIAQMLQQQATRKQV
jgi:adenylate kinase